MGLVFLKVKGTSLINAFLCVAEVIINSMIEMLAFMVFKLLKMV